MANPAAEARVKAQAKWAGATVAERGRSFIRHQHPTEPNRFMLDSFIGPIHYGPGEDQEIDTAWQPSSGAWDYEAVENDFRYYVRDSVPVSYRYEDVATGHFAELTVNAIEWVNDEGQSAAATSFSQVTPTINDDRITWTNIAPGWHVRVESQTARLAKWLDIDSLASLGAPTIGGTNPALSFEFRFQKSVSLDMYIDGVLWDEKGNNPQSTASNVEFRDNTSGTPVFWFRAPIGNDVDGDPAPMSLRVRKVGNNLLSAVRVPWAWLQAAAYPISLDDTIDPQVSASADDAREAGNGVNSITAATYDVNSSGERVAARWQATGPASGDTVDVAYIQWYISNTPASAVDHLIHIEDEDSAAAYVATSNNISGRTYDSNTVSWSGSITDDAFNSTPSIVTPLQNIINRVGWSSGNYIGHQNVWNAASNNRFNMYDSASAEAPKLHIEYTAGGDPAPSVSDDATATDSVTVDVSDPQASAQDDAEASESVDVDLQIDASVSDSATATDSAAATLASNVTEQDDATATDSATLAIPVEVSVQDDATATDTSTLDIPVEVSVQDDATATDSATVAIVSISDLTVSVQDDATASDTVTVFLPIGILVQDDATATDTSTLDIALAIAAQDDATATDSATAAVETPATFLSVNISKSANYVQVVTP
jgi:hypothetical protein